MKRSAIIISFMILIYCTFLGGSSLVHALSIPDECTLPPDVEKSRPDPEGVPTPVDVGIIYFDVLAIEETNQTFTADLYITVKWSDPRLSKDALGYSVEGCRFKKNELWQPEFLYMNKRKIDRGFQDFGRVDELGNVTMYERVTGTFTVNYNLKDFPLDTQTLPIKIGFPRYTPEEVVFRGSEKTSGFFSEVTIAGWDIREGSVTVKPIAVVQEGDAERSMLVSNLIAKRQVGYYAWKVFVPLCLIVFMSWMVFWINPEHFGPQVGLSTATVFTLIAFMISLGRLIPEVSYLTRLDQCILSATVMVFSALGIAIMTSRLAHRKNVTLAKNIEKVIRIFYLPFYAVIFYMTLFL